MAVLELPPRELFNTPRGMEVEGVDPALVLKTLQSHLECSLCLSLVCEPITAGCGHTFCRVCHISAETAPENIMVKSVALLADPDGYAAKLTECAAEKLHWSAVFPVFYYDATIFPGNRLNLMLFEPRYKLMAQRIVNTSRSFAYVPNFVSYSASVGDVALVVHLRDVEFLGDGRSYMDAVVTARHTIVDHYVEEGTQNLHYCRLEPRRDELTPQEQQEALQRALAGARAYLDKLRMGEVERRLGTPPSDPEDFSLWMVSLSPLPERVRMQLLCSNDTLQRLDVVLQSLSEMEERVRNNPVNRVASFLSSWFAGTQRTEPDLETTGDGGDEESESSGSMGSRSTESGDGVGDGEDEDDEGSESSGSTGSHSTEGGESEGDDVNQQPIH